MKVNSQLELFDTVNSQATIASYISLILYIATYTYVYTCMVKSVKVKQTFSDTSQQLQCNVKEVKTVYSYKYVYYSVMRLTPNVYSRESTLGRNKQILLEGEMFVLEALLIAITHLRNLNLTASPLIYSSEILTDDPL